MLKLKDLPTDPDQIKDDTIAFLDDQFDTDTGTATFTEVIVILGQLDPTETIENPTYDPADLSGGPKFVARWSGEQQSLILAARDQLEEWQS